MMNELKKAFVSSRRSVLLVAGAFLEDQVSVCALEALVEGFDVHPLCDLFSARDRGLVPVLQLRLFQAGVVPTSMQQMLYVWHAAEEDGYAAAELKRLQVEYEVVMASPHSPSRPARTDPVSFSILTIAFDCLGPSGINLFNN
jgi:hypothetical protein